MSAGSGKLRLFVGITVPAEIKSRLAAMQRELRDRLGRASVSWTRPENFHITLRFLGDVPSNRVDDVTAALAAASAPQALLELAVVGIGCFPNTRRPRVLWAGVRDEGGRLTELARRIAVATNSFSSQPAEERFTGHLTLGRFRNIGREDSKALGQFIRESAERALGTWRAGTVDLVRSELHPAGSRYTTLARLPLEGGTR